MNGQKPTRACDSASTSPPGSAAARSQPLPAPRLQRLKTAVHPWRLRRPSPPRPPGACAAGSVPLWCRLFREQVLHRARTGSPAKPGLVHGWLYWRTADTASDWACSGSVIHPRTGITQRSAAAHLPQAASAFTVATNSGRGMTCGVSGLWRASMDVICICMSNEFYEKGIHMMHLPACREFTPITMSMSIDVIVTCLT